jgi:hypothetical protein
MNLDKALKLRESLSHSLFNLLDNTRRFHWSHEFYMQKLLEFHHMEAFKIAPLWIKHHLEGLEWGIMREIWREVEFSYEVNGKRLTLSDPEYRGHPAQYISEHCANSGAHVWRADTSKFWTMPGIPAQPIRG